jgi:hypothetical protein
VARFLPALFALQTAVLATLATALSGRAKEDAFSGQLSLSILVRDKQLFIE